MKQTKIKSFFKPFLSFLLLISVSGCTNSNKVTVEFDTVGGTPISSQTLDIGSLIEEPSGVEKEGYVLDGWFYDGVEWDFDTPVDENMTLVANWVSDSSVVNFLLNGGNSTISSQTYHYGENVKLPRPTRNGYVFLGRYYGEELVTDGNWTILGNVTLRASWAKEKITLTYLDGLSVIGTQVVEYQKPYELLNYSKDTVDVVSWSCEGIRIPLSGAAWNYSVDDVRLTPIRESRKYNLSVKGMEEDEYTCPAQVTLNIGQTNKLPVPNVNNSKNCGDFQGWFLDGERVSDNKGVVSKNWFPENEKNELEAIFGHPINSASDFKNIRNNLEGFYYLTCDIDLGGMEWTPIGSAENPFTGAVFGFGYTIQNFKITNPTTHGALFAFAEEATFYDFEVSNARFEYSTPLGKQSYCSAVCAFGYGCKFEKVFVLSNNIFNIVSRSSQLRVSSVAYSDDSLFRNCLNEADIFCGEMVGGIGLAEGGGHTQFDSCINYGDIKSIGNAFGIGWAEHDYSTTYLNCVNFGNITGDVVSGIGNYNYLYFYPTYLNCINYGDINGNSSSGIGSGEYGAYYDNSLGENDPFYLNCVNYGDINGSETAEGIGYVSCRINGFKDIYIAFANCVNYGTISVNYESPANLLDFCCGIGRTDTYREAFNYFVDCLNLGTINSFYEYDSFYESQSLGLGNGTHFVNCINLGDLYSSGKVSATKANSIISLQSVLNYCKMTGKKEVAPLVDSSVEYYDCFDSYYCCEIGAESGEVVNTDIGTEVLLTQLNGKFLREKMNFDDKIRNLDDVNFARNIYPSLRGKPFDDLDTLKNLTSYDNLLKIIENRN